ncbi:hypothetical protein [Lentzea cavernae]|uniref:Uncharacterized protein n=1 Tax=Lentzea cavernae TaxID=2020703 RepID=A0ABQ3MRP3_9PSEU|nr:hypothetical protein [Lentzea cavernae]GHH57735.1 hypothetical protein GCM10017774_77820 [Lentzea cavernae]
MARPWHCTREDVMARGDIKLTARMATQVDDAIEAATRDVEKRLHRILYPRLETHRFDWPGEQSGRTWRLWLDQHEVISVTTLTSGGLVIPSTDFFLYPDSGPPYNRIEIDLASNAAFGGGSTHQRDVEVLGLHGYNDDSKSASALAAAVSTTTATTVDVTNAAAVGVGDLIKLGSERMIVTGRAMVDTTINAAGSLTANLGNQTLPVSDGSAFNVGEILLLDAERVRVDDIAGNTLFVTRQWDGTVLAAHNTGIDIYAARRLTVERGAVGTTAATHLSGASITRWPAPGPVKRLTIAEAQTTLAQESTAWARVIGQGEAAREAWARSLNDARNECYENYGRKARIRAVAR